MSNVKNKIIYWYACKFTPAEQTNRLYIGQISANHIFTENDYLLYRFIFSNKSIEQKTMW